MYSLLTNVRERYSSDVNFTNNSELGFVDDAYKAAALGSMEEFLKNDDQDANVVFGLEDGAYNIAHVLSSDGNALDAAEEVIVSYGSATIDEAGLIQGIQNYNAESSAYSISDSASAILSAEGQGIVENSGVDGVYVDSDVSVDQGIALSDLNIDLQNISASSNAHIDFSVSGAAADILNAGVELSGASNIEVNDGPVEAAVGVQLDALNESLQEFSPDSSYYSMGSGSEMSSESAMGYEANIIDYAIQDSAKDIADALIVSSSSTNLDSAISVVATVVP